MTARMLTCIVCVRASDVPGGSSGLGGQSQEAKSPGKVVGRPRLELGANGLRVHRPSAKRSQKTGSR